MSQSKEKNRLVIVVGCWSGGTSCVAGIVEKLGVDFKAVPRWSMEYPEFGDLCRSLLTAPFWGSSRKRVCEISTRDERIKSLRTFFDTFVDGTVGLKHPLVSLMVDEIALAWPGDLTFIHVRRKTSAIIQSLERRNWMKKDNIPSAVIQMLNGSEKALVNHSHIQVIYEHVLDDPYSSVVYLAEHIGLGSTPSQIAEAARSVKLKRPTTDIHSLESRAASK